MTKKATPKRPAKARKTKRSSISGMYGDGATAAEELARRIIEKTCGYYSEAYKARLLPMVKAELLAATTVTEEAAKVIGSGWVEIYEGEIWAAGTFPGDARRDPGYLRVWNVRPCADTAQYHAQYVHLIAATPPRARAARKGGRK